MQAYLLTIVCKFGGDPANCLREEGICAKVYRQTDGRTDDGRRAIALAHSWNELIIIIIFMTFVKLNVLNVTQHKVLYVMAYRSQET